MTKLTEEQIELLKLLKDFKNHKGTPASAYKDHIRVLDIEHVKDLLSAKDLEAEQKVEEAVRLERGNIIKELEQIEKDKWEDSNHCSCLGYAIFNLKCNCEKECGKCRIKKPPKD